MYMFIYIYIYIYMGAAAVVGIFKNCYGDANALVRFNLHTILPLPISYVE